MWPDEAVTKCRFVAADSRRAPALGGGRDDPRAAGDLAVGMFGRDDLRRCSCRRRWASRRSLVSLTLSGELWRHLRRRCCGWRWAGRSGRSTGIALGLAVGLFTLARSPGMAVVSALFPIPKIALVPLFIIWFGIGEGSKIATLAFGVFFPTVIRPRWGGQCATQPDPHGQSFGLSRWAIIRSIVLPGALPAILSGSALRFPSPSCCWLQRK